MKEFKSKRLRVWENINRTMQEFKVLLLGYRSYTALLTQSGTDAPVATVLENTLGEISFSYTNPGVYKIESDGLFTVGKTWTSSSLVNDGANGVYQQVIVEASNTSGAFLPDEIILRTYGGDFNGDGLLNSTPIEIRVYN
jgi:hypothetical protein